MSSIRLNENYNKINESELYIKYKSSYVLAVRDFSLHCCYVLFSFFLLWHYKNSYFNIVTIPVFALLNIKTFIIFHDCCHNSYTPNKTLNLIISHITGTLTLTTPNWILDHHIHHLTNGNTENKYNFKFNELVNVTKKQYHRFSTLNKYIYCFIHHPVIFFTIIPFFYFFLLQRGMYLFKKIKYNNKISKPFNLIFMNDFVNNAALAILYLSLIHI